MTNGQSLLGAPPRSGRTNLKDEVAAHLRAAIYTGGLRPGRRIDQDAVAAELGVSKLPVREALIALESEGLIQNVARRGAFVAEITPDDVLDHYRIYGRVSGLAAGRAAESMSQEGIAELVQIQTSLEQVHDVAGQEELNFRFHRIINLAGGTRRLQAVVRLLSNTLHESFYEFASGWRDIAIIEHGRILEAIRDGDRQAADQAMVDHITSGGQYAIDLLASRGFWSPADDLRPDPAATVEPVR